MNRLMLTLAFLVVFVANASAQNPCAVTAPTTVGPSGSNQFWAELPEHTATRPDGSPLVAAYQFGAWLEGANPNATNAAQGPSTLPKTAFVPVAGFPPCYSLTGGLPGLIPQQARMGISLRAQASPGATAPFGLGSALSNSFSLASTQVPAAPGRTRIQG